MAANSDDDEEEDSYVVLGSALPVFDTDEAPLRKPVGVHEQTVRDAQGRLRFHGAFTGGFSAGYFNTAGSKEGWAPKPFVSSRSQRADVPGLQKPEDYMDEEDLGEFGIAPRIIATKENFLSNERDRKRKTAVVSSLSDKSSIPGAASVFVDLILPKRSSIGIRLLRKLGWKDGQGVGPRVKRKQDTDVVKEAQDTPKVYGCIMPPGFAADRELSSDDDELESVTFAPQDVCPISFEAKDNVHGIGYRGIDPRLALGNFSSLQSTAVTTAAGKRGIRGQAFGVGAFERDDDDIYGVDSMANYDRELGEENIEKRNFGWTAPKHHIESNTTMKAIGHMADVLPGFKKASSSLQPKKIYAPPQLPKDFKPFHRFDLAQQPNSSSTSMGSTTKALDSYSRGALLGEVPHLNSVFELVSGEDKARMEASKMHGAILKKQQEKAPEMEKIGITPGAVVSQDISVLEASLLQFSSTSQLATTLPASQTTMWKSAASFMPFAKNPEKQKRYEAYLEAMKYGKTYESSDGGDKTEWEQQREREEFSQAARLYRPMAGMMASRFTRAQHDDDDKVVRPTEQEREKSDKEKAVSMKLFGKLTRERFEWHPDKLICKRFNIANPYPESSIVGVPCIKRDKYSVFNFLSFPEQDTGNTSQRSETEVVENSAASITTSKAVTSVPSVNVKPLAILATVDLRPKSVTASTDQSENLEQVNDVIPVEAVSNEATDGRPSMDLFKAIFENSESDASSESDSEEEVQTSTTTPIVGSTSHPSKPVVLPHSDAVSMKSASSFVMPEQTALLPAFVNSPAESSANSSESDDETRLRTDDCTANGSSHSAGDNTFGPALPPATSMEIAEHISTDSRHPSSRRHHRRKDSHSHKKSKHKKKKSKQKKSKEKVKEKVKKKKKNKSVVTINSSSSSDADVEDDDSEELSALDRKLLSRLKKVSA